MSETLPSREEILRNALVGREHEVMQYQINIDNYTIALQEIEKMSVEERAEIASFADHLRKLLASEKAEQRKASLMLHVLKKQVDG